MPERQPMICPHCRIPMNHHAEKIDYAAAMAEPQAMDPDFGGVVEEVHSCGGCGETATRRSTR